MKISNNTTFADIIFAKCKDDFDRIRVIMNVYDCNKSEAVMYLKKGDVSNEGDGNEDDKL